MIVRKLPLLSFSLAHCALSYINVPVSIAFSLHVYASLFLTYCTSTCAQASKHYIHQYTQYTCIVWAIVARRFLNVQVLIRDDNRHKLRVIKFSGDNSSTHLSKGSKNYHFKRVTRSALSTVALTHIVLASSDCDKTPSFSIFIRLSFINS